MRWPHQDHGSEIYAGLAIPIVIMVFGVYLLYEHAGSW